MPRHPPSPDTFTPRQYAGAMLLDLPRFAAALRPAGLGGDWTRFGNREDVLEANPSGRGVRCGGEITRPLHLCKVFPSLAMPLLRRALDQWPVQFQTGPAQATPDGVCANGDSPGAGAPDASFLIGHRGLDRLPQLLLVLQSIAAQRDVRFECIVVEQSPAPEIQSSLPVWVRYVHTPCAPQMPYARAWAFNVAAANARGGVLVFHDNDLLLPSGYAVEALNRHREGWEVANLKRFIFYLSAQCFPGTCGGARSHWGSVQLVLENALAGGSLAMARDAFESIGGWDESFVGWGGEDNEFWDRCQTRRVWNYGYLPLLHLWHPPQPGKRARHGMGEDTSELTLRRRALPAAERIAELRARPRGQADGPFPPWRGAP